MKVKKRTSLKTKLILSLLVVVATSGAGSLIVGQAIIEKNIIDQAYEDIAQKLLMFRDIYDNKLYVKHRLLNTIASYPAFQRDIRDGNKNEIYRVIREILKEPTFDILNVTDADGRVLVRSRNFGSDGDLVAGDTFVRRVMKRREPVYGFDVMDREQLLPEGYALAERAIVQTVPTDRARPVEKKLETRGMFLKVATPVFCDGTFVGIVYGALLLNHDVTIPDRAQSLVFGEEKIDGLDIGTATLFLDDLRISTNVKGRDGKRAVGTQVSREVYQKVFEGGKIWRDKAFVVDHWVIAAYQPLKDIENRTIGMIYAGVLEEKYSRIKRDAMSSLLLLICVSGLVSLALAWYLVLIINRPIKALVAAAEEVARGRYAKVELQTADEMGYLGEVFNKMVDALAEKDRRLMDHMERQAVQTEKLASLGRLASGIAHEINNPLTGVLVYCDSLLETLEGTEHAADLMVIHEETLRCREIVKGILDFARETKLEVVQANLNGIITDVLMILEKHVAFQNVRIVRHLDPSIPDSLVDVNQIKSVINNLAVNAADAMSGGGTITIDTCLSADGKYVRMRVTDTGCGISEENLEKVFDPFFTTKNTGQGTGLGLSVTYGIVKRHNGYIHIASLVGEGTTIDIHLPVGSHEEGNNERASETPDHR